MRKKVIVSLFITVICLCLVGCKKDEKKVSDWTLNLNEKEVTMATEDKEIFDKAASNYSSMKLTPIALLGEQVVAGKNYMFLAKTDDAFKVVVVYKDLEGKATITKVSDFDVTKYVNENISIEAPELVGGWQTNVPGKPIMLDEDIQSAFDKANEKIVGVSYYPVTVLAHQEKSGTNYAILCYGRLSDQNGTMGVFIQTLYIDENNTTEVVSIANIKLADYNK